MEAKNIPITHNEPSVSIIAQQIPQMNTQGITRAIPLPTEIPIIPNAHNPPQINPISPPSVNPSEGQPDVEPEIPSTNSQPSTPTQEIQQEHHPIPFSSNREGITEDDPAVNTPIPDDNADDELICEGLRCVDMDTELCFVAEEEDLAWRCEVLVTADDIRTWQEETDPTEMAFVVSAAKKQRSEVKMSTLNAQEKEQFQKAKETEVQNWLKTGTVSRILREKYPMSKFSDADGS